MISCECLIHFLFHFCLLFSSALKLITPDDPTQPLITAANCQLVESTIMSLVDHLQMRLRKRSYEEESYRIARESTFGWRTEKKFRKDPIFLEENLDDDSMWYEKPELTKEKKLEKLRTAERDVKFEITNMRKLQQQQFGNGGSFQSGFHARQQHQNQFYPQQQFQHQSQSQPYSQQSQSSFYNRQLPYPPRQDNRKCGACGLFGHIARFCSVKSQQQNSERVRQQDQNQPHTGRN